MLEKSNTRPAGEQIKLDLQNKLGLKVDLKGSSTIEDVLKKLENPIAAGVKDGEPSEFSEPGLFLIDNNNKVYYSATNSNPWGRPYLASFVKAVDYIVQSGYPARGEML